MQAIIQESNLRADGTRDTFQTFTVEAKRAPMRHHKHGLTWTATGYGMRIPTEDMVKIKGRWRRVYCRIFSNCGTCYVGQLGKVGEQLIVQDMTL